MRQGRFMGAERTGAARRARAMAGRRRGAAAAAARDLAYLFRCEFFLGIAHIICLSSAAGFFVVPDIQRRAGVDA